jgi:hypothetical protein
MKLVWKPSASDLAWNRNLVATMRDGGVWASPAAGRVYKFDKVNNKLSVVATFPLCDEDHDEIHDRIKISFAEIGYAVVEAV